MGWFQSQSLTKETEKSGTESSFIGNSAGLIYTYTLLFLLKDAKRWNFGAHEEHLGLFESRVYKCGMIPSPSALSGCVHPVWRSSISHNFRLIYWQWFYKSCFVWTTTLIGTAVAQQQEWTSTNQKISGSIPASLYHESNFLGKDTQPHVASITLLCDQEKSTV